MKTLKEALIKRDRKYKYIEHQEPIEQWDIVQTRNGLYWCVILDQKMLDKTCLDIDSWEKKKGVLIYYDKSMNKHWNPLLIYDGYECISTARGKKEIQWDMIKVWRNNKLVPPKGNGIYEFLKEDNLMLLTKQWSEEYSED